VYCDIINLCVNYLLAHPFCLCLAMIVWLIIRR